MIVVARAAIGQAMSILGFCLRSAILLRTYMGAMP